MNATKKDFRKYKKDSDASLYRKLASRILVIALVLAAMYFWGLAIFANIDTFWETLNLRPKGASTITHRNQRPLLPPRIDNLPEAVKEETITISGTSEEGTTVELFVNREEQDTTLVDTSGSFNFENVELKEEENVIWVVAKDSKNQRTQRSDEVTVVVDKEKPELAVASPSEGQEFKQKENKITVSGQTETDATLTINGQLIIVGAGGDFNQLYALNAGENILTFKAQDVAGNETVIAIKVNFSQEF